MNTVEKKWYESPEMTVVNVFPQEEIGNLRDNNADEPMLYRVSNGWGPWV